jgi:allantoinase
MPSTIPATSVGPATPSDRIVVTSSRVVLNGHEAAAPATLEISPTSGKFVAIQSGKAKPTDYPPDTQFFDYGDLVIMPGLVDSHVHIDEP